MLKYFVLDKSSNDISELLPESVSGKCFNRSNFIFIDILGWVSIKFLQEFNKFFQFLSNFSENLFDGTSQYFGND